MHGWESGKGRTSFVLIEVSSYHVPSLTCNFIPKILYFLSFSQEAGSLPLFSRKPYNSLKKSLTLSARPYCPTEMLLGLIPVLKYYLLAN